MLPPSYLESLPVGIVQTYAYLESWIIADISRRIAGADFVMTPTAEWQIKKAQMMRLSYDDIVKQVSRTLGKSQKEVRELFKEAGLKALESDAKLYALAGKDPSEFMNSLALNRTLQAGIEQTNGLMKNFTNSLASQSNKLLEDLLDQAYFETTSGAWSYQTSIRKAIRQLARQGLQTITYPSGHTDQVDVAVRRAVITGINQTCARLQLDLASDMGCDLVETTSHGGARPSHQEWQGKVFSLSGKNRKYPDFKSSTGYGTGEGLCGINCRHNFYPFFEGISVPADTPEMSAKESNELYEATQKQRAYERQIRRHKRTVEATKSAIKATNDKELTNMLEQDKKLATERLRTSQSKLDNLCDTEDLARRKEREAIVKATRSQKPDVAKPIQKTKQEPQHKKYTLQELQSMNITQLRKIAKREAMTYYPGSGISFGADPNYDKITDGLIKDASKSSLIKDIRSLQKKNKK